MLKFGVYDAVAKFNIGMKSSIVVYEKLNMIPGYYTIKGLNDINKIRIKWSIYRGNLRNKLRRQKLRAEKRKKCGKTLEKEGKTYETGGF